MSWAALGCNPSQGWTDPATDPIAVPVGTLSFSQDGNIWMCVQAAQAEGIGVAGEIDANFRFQRRVGAANTGSRRLCFPQRVFADEEYGWALVWGTGLVLAGEAIAAGTQVNGISASNGPKGNQATTLSIPWP